MLRHFLVSLSKAVLIWTVLPYSFLLLPAGDEWDQQKLDRITAKIERLESACEDPYLKDVLSYTTRRYSKVQRGGVAIHPIRFAGGFNIPWCPGFIIDSTVWSYCDDAVLQVMVHEAMHDYPPYFFHSHIKGLVLSQGCDGITDLERLLEKVD